MNKKEQFKPDPPPTLYADILTTEKEPRRLFFRVKGKETFVDDKWLEARFPIGFEESDGVQEFKSKDGKVVAKLRVKV